MVRCPLRSGGPLRCVLPAANGEASRRMRDRLFRNRGDGSFVDVTEASGLGGIARRGGYGLGVTVGDYDRDGRPDLFVTWLPYNVWALPEPGRRRVRRCDRTCQAWPGATT